MRQQFNFSDGFKEISRRLNRSPQPLLVAIAGGSCSGKSYLTAKLQELQGSEAISVCLDDFFKDEDDPTLPYDDQGRLIFDLPDSYHQAEFQEIIRGLLRGEPVVLPCYEKGPNRRNLERSRLIQPAPIVMAEGLFALSFLADFTVPQLRIFLDADLEMCLERRIARDTIAFGVSAGRVRDIFTAKVLPYYQDYVLPQRRLADLVITS